LKAVQNNSKPRVVAFDAALAAMIAERLAQGLHPSLVALQLARYGDPELIGAYVREIQDHPYFRGATAGADALRKRRSWRRRISCAVIMPTSGRW